MKLCFIDSCTWVILNFTIFHIRLLIFKIKNTYYSLM